jgi:hypothetical protein
MKETALISVGLLLVLLLSGCRSEFAYNAPPADADSAGPSIVILPLTDNRTNHMADSVFKKKYLTKAQESIGQELESMKEFSSVMLATNGQPVPKADLQLALSLRQLDWKVHHHGGEKTEKVALHVFEGVVGLPVTDVLIFQKTAVYGHLGMDATLQQTVGQKILWNEAYSVSVTNVVKRTDCDKRETKAAVMLAAFQLTQTELKDDLFKELMQPKGATADNESK